MTEHTPTTEEVREHWRSAWHPRNPEASDASFDRWLAAHDAEVRAQGHHVVPCAQCGQKPVVANDALNSDIVVCGDCGVQIGLHELPEVRASVVPEEPEWEWALMADGDDEPWSDYYKTREHLAERLSVLAWREDEHLVRRRAPGPWLPVEQEEE